MSAKAAADKIAGVLGLSQQPEADAKVRVETGNILAVFPVWAVALFGGALVNLAYPAYLMTKNKSWGVLATNWPEVGLSIIMGVQFCVAVVLAGKGMLLLGVLGASVGAGIQQAMQMVGGQGLGFISGEWRGVHGKPRRQMYFAIALLIVATIIMAYANTIDNDYGRMNSRISDPVSATADQSWQNRGPYESRHYRLQHGKYFASNRHSATPRAARWRPCEIGQRPGADQSWSATPTRHHPVRAGQRGGDRRDAEEPGDRPLRNRRRQRRSEGRRGQGNSGLQRARLLHRRSGRPRPGHDPAT